jgi:hypothetical protein
MKRNIILILTLLSLFSNFKIISQDNSNQRLFERQGFGVQIWNNTWIKYPGDEGYDSFIKAINDLGKTNSNYVHICFSVELTKSDGTTFLEKSDVTMTDEQLEYLIDLIRKMKLDIDLKPGFWFRDPKFAMMNYKPDNVDKWFANWEKVLLHYAAICEKKKVKTLDIAYEMTNLTNGYYDKWKKLITDVRKVFHGEISANFLNPEEGRKAVFLKDLDVVQTSCFYRHTGKKDPTIEELVASWNSTFDGINIVDDLHSLYLKSGGKPFLIGDIAFISMPGANSNWNVNINLEDKADYEEQADQYEAFFRVFSTQGKGWFTGVTFLTWFPFDPLNSSYKDWSWEIGEKGRSIQGKPALKVILKWFNKTN